ncbi:MAG: hypothetical protein HY081_04305 [Gammaproteobacteria bacterium]|nr:hypothetical protein [Gammaproteobacteria bacterium]
MKPGLASDSLDNGLSSIAGAWRLVLENKPLWFGMTAVYFVFGFLVKLIPFMGDLLLVLITPMLLTSIVWNLALANQTQASRHSHRPFNANEFLQTWIIHPAQELISIFAHEEKAFAAVLLGIVTLGLTMLVKIAGYLLVGGSMISGLTATDLSTPQLTQIAGMLFVAILNLVLVMGLLYSVPFTVLGNRQPLAAISESFSTCFKHRMPVLMLLTPFFLIYLTIFVAFAKYHWLGYVFTFSIGFISAPILVAAVYTSYIQLFPANHASAQR